MSVPRMTLGSQGLQVSAQGLSCMGISAFYFAPKPEADMTALIHHAVAAGVIFLDTSDLYSPHTNELLLGKALQDGVREKVQLATKFSISPDCKREVHKREVHGDPACVWAACECSLRRLGIDCIDLYYQHRIDKQVMDKGRYGFLGLSGAILVQEYHTLHIDPSTFVVMLAVLPTAITLMLMYFVDVHSAHERCDVASSSIIPHGG